MGALGRGRNLVVIIEYVFQVKSLRRGGLRVGGSGWMEGG